MKKIVLLFSLFLVPFAIAGDAPRGFMELSEIKEAQAKATKSGKLIAIVAKGADDNCPRCAAALENGTKAIKSDCVLVFSRVEEVRKGSGLPATVTKETADATGGASVTFYVFDPELKTLVAEANRTILESDRDATKEFKKKVKAARKKLQG